MKYKPIFYKIVEDRLEMLFKTTFADNAAFTAAACTACGLLAAADGPLQSVYPFAFAIMTLAWITASCSAGFLKQWFFIPYSAAFWLLPHLFIDAAHDIKRMEELTVFNNVLAHISELLAYDAPKLLTGLGLSEAVVSQGFFTASLLLFAAGFMLRKRARRYRFYCEVRSRLIQNSSE